MGKKTLSSSESGNIGQKSRGAEKTQVKKASKGEKTSRKERALLVDTENVRRSPPKRQSMSKGAAAKDNGHNVNSPTGRPQMKKNISDILQPKKALLPAKKTISKPKSICENRTPSPKRSLELSVSSMPSLNLSPSEIHQYVENWLDKVSPDPVPYTEEAVTDESEPRTKVVFQIGGGSESDEKSECQTRVEERHPSASDAVKKSASCLSVLHEAAALLPNEQYARGLCVSMPSVRVDPVEQENRLRPHKSAEVIGPADKESSKSSKVLDPNIKHVLRELYSSIHCIPSETNKHPTSRSPTAFLISQHMWRRCSARRAKPSFHSYQ